MRRREAWKKEGRGRRWRIRSRVTNRKEEKEDEK